MSEILGALLEGLLYGIFEGISHSASEKFTRLTLGGKQGSEFMIRYAEETGGTEGLIRESKRRSRTNFILGILVFVLCFEFFFWIIALLANYSKDFEWFRNNGFWLFAGTALVFISIILISRRIVTDRMLRVSFHDHSILAAEFEVPGSNDSAMKNLLFAFGFVFGLFFIFLTVYYFTAGRSQVTLILLFVLFSLSAGMIILAVVKRPDIIPIMHLTSDGIYKGSDTTIPQTILWNNIKDISAWKGNLRIQFKETDSETSVPMIIGLDHSLLNSEILAYKCRQYLNMNNHSSEICYPFKKQQH